MTEDIALKERVQTFNAEIKNDFKITEEEQENLENLELETFDYHVFEAIKNSQEGAAGLSNQSQI